MPSSADSLHVIVPANAEARAHDLVITAIEVREEQYDHKPDHGDVLAATLHVRPAGAPAPANMAADAAALVRVRSDDGPAGATWQRYRFAVTGGDRSAVVLSVSRLPAAATPGVASLKLPANNGAGEHAGLAITVVEVVEKRTMEGDSMMRVKLHLRRAGTPAPTADALAAESDALVTLTSDPGGDVITWNGWRLTYRGGWRDEVELQIVAPTR